MKSFIQIQLMIIILLNTCDNKILELKNKKKNKLNETSLLKHDHSYSIQFNPANIQNFQNLVDFTDDLDDTNDDLAANNKTTFKYKNTCSYFLPSCLCSSDTDTQLHVLYCNDPNLKRIPNFKTIHNKNLFSNYTSLIFSKVDFSHSGIRRINKNDLTYLNLSLSPKINNSTTNRIEDYLSKLSTRVLYHLDFENIIEIEDGSFEDFTRQYVNNSNNETTLRIRFSNSYFNFLYSNRKPFKGLNVLKLHFNNISNKYFPNTVFDESILGELLIENMLDFIGFVDSNSLPTGKLLKKFIAVKSYNIDSLCSHSLPSFVNQETFTEIIIRKCISLKSIKPFTFFKYPHLKELVLSSNSIEIIHKNSFSHLTQLEFLDLSFNPINLIEDDSFKSLISLKRLNLESTQLKQIEEFTLSGLFNLEELKLTKSNLLSWIHGKAFDSFKTSLNELNLKETNVSLIDSIYSDGIKIPYIKPKNWINNPVWLDGLNLTTLKMESLINYKHEKRNTSDIICKLMRYLSPYTIVNLNRNLTCNCIIYSMFRNKYFVNRSDWEFKTPICYRSQIEYFKNGSRSFQKILNEESKCKLDTIETDCFQAVTTTTTATTTTIISRKIVPIYAKTSTKPPNLPRLDFRKLFKVIAVIILVSIISIFLTVFLMRYARLAKKRKKAKQLAKSNLVKSKPVRLVMPPASLPKIESHFYKSKFKKSQTNISRLVI